jgi:lipopolysaccharide biosynthesis glycosyltransferase
MSNNSTIIPVFYSVDDNYATVLHAGVQSIKDQANPEREYHVHILTENLAPQFKQSFESMATRNVNVTVTDLTDLSKKYSNQFYNRDNLNNTAWFRLFIPGMYPQYDKAIYLDSDTIVNCDIAELYDHDITDYYAAVATCETCDSFPPFTDYIQKYMGFAMPWYFNNGVVLFNCKLLRQDNFEAKFFDLINKHQFELIQDQDSMNVLFRGKCLFLPQVWNKIPLIKPGINDDNVKIVHYNLVFRPWRYDGVHFADINYDKIPFEDIFWKHAKNCPMYQQILDIKANYSKEQQEIDENMMLGLVIKADKYSSLPREQTWGGLEFMRKVTIKG